MSTSTCSTRGQPSQESCSGVVARAARKFVNPPTARLAVAGNAQIAVLTGMFGSDNYNWRSMTSPGITGLFNSNCLRSGAANLMTCYPGDNTFDGVQTAVSLVNSNSQFHSLTTTVATNGEFYVLQCQASWRPPNAVVNAAIGQKMSQASHSTCIVHPMVVTRAFVCTKPPPCCIARLQSYPRRNVPHFTKQLACRT